MVLKGVLIGFIFSVILFIVDVIFGDILRRNIKRITIERWEKVNSNKKPLYIIHRLINIV